MLSGKGHQASVALTEPRRPCSQIQKKQCENTVLMIGMREHCPERERKGRSIWMRKALGGLAFWGEY